MALCIGTYFCIVDFKWGRGVLALSEAGETNHADSRARPVTLRVCLPNIMFSIKEGSATLLLVDEATLREIISEEVTSALAQVKDRPRRSYTRQEVCEMLHVSLMTLDGYIKRGDIRANKIGRRVLIDADAVDEAIESGKVRRYKHTYA